MIKKTLPQVYYFSQLPKRKRKKEVFKLIPKLSTHACEQLWIRKKDFDSRLNSPK